MAGPDPRGSVFKTRTGAYGIRWPEAGKRPQKTGFRTKTDAREWFRESVAPRLREASPDPSITYDDFCALFLERHGATVAARTSQSLEERLAPSRRQFGAWTLRELEHAAGDVAAWRAGLSDTSRYRLTSAMRQALGAAVRWRYVRCNPAVDAGRNPQPRAEELLPFMREEIDALDAELGAISGPLVVFAAETGLRTAEWVGLERRDVDRQAGAVAVQRRVADGVVTPYPKTVRSRRSVPLTSRALDALERLPARLDTKILFPAPTGGYIGLDTWRTREWYDALDAAGIARRGPYHLRHTFATEALAAGISTWELSRIMGTSVAMIDRTYGPTRRSAPGSTRERRNLASTWRRTRTAPAATDAASPHGVRVCGRWSVPGSNRRPPACKAGALPAELTPRAVPL
jgi:integrase